MRRLCEKVAMGRLQELLSELTSMKYMKYEALNLPLRLAASKGAPVGEERYCYHCSGRVAGGIER